MAKAGKPFGRRNAKPPPLVLNAPDGLAGAAAPSSRRKTSLTLGLVSLGAAALAGGALIEARQWRGRDDACRTQATTGGERPAECPPNRGSSGSHGGGRSWFWSSGGGARSTTTARSATRSTGHALFGGFGRSGAAHSGGS